jgi:hypothetical protein
MDGGNCGYLTAATAVEEVLILENGNWCQIRTCANKAVWLDDSGSCAALLYFENAGRPSPEASSLPRNLSSAEL